MPGKDKTGPQGYGPGTGRGGGGCAEGVSAANVMGAGRGMRNGNLGNRGNRGGGGRRGRWSCNGFVEKQNLPGEQNPERKLKNLEMDRAELDGRIDTLHKQIDALRKEVNQDGDNT